METPEQLIDRLKRQCGVRSDYAIAKILGVTRSNMSLLKTGKVKAFSEDVGLRIADLLKENPGYVFACLSGARSLTPASKTVWERVAHHMRAAVLAVTFVATSTFFVTLGTPSPAQADTTTVYYVKYWRRLWAALRAWCDTFTAATPCAA